PKIRGYQAPQMKNSSTIIRISLRRIVGVMGWRANRIVMAPMSAKPLDSDQAHLLHPLHHPSAYAKARVWVSGDGAILRDSTGREYIDGLSGLWNVNVGPRRKELGEAAQMQMGTLAFSSAYAGGTNERAIELAEKLSALMYPSINTFFFTSGGAASPETSVHR